jgi:tetratricopeptide (TPR) repeat protein
LNKVLSELSRFYQIGHFDQIIKLIEANSQLLQDIQIANLLAVAYRRTGLFEQSQKCFESILSNSQHSGIHVSYAMLLSDMKLFDKAYEHFESAVKLNSDYFDAFLNLGIVATKRGDKRKALGAYKQAHQLKPQHFGALSGLINSLIVIEDLSSAIKLCQDSTLNQHHQLSLALFTIKIKLKQFKLVEVEKDISLLLDIHPSSFDIKLLMSRLMLQKGDISEGIKLLKSLHYKSPCDIEVQTLIFECLTSSKAQNPFEFYELACQKEINKTLIIDYFFKLMKVKKFGDAQRLIETHHLHFKGDDNIHILNSIIFREMNSFDKAFEQLKQISIDSTSYGSALYEKVITFLCEKKYEEAYRGVLEGIDLEPEASRWKSLEYTCRKYFPFVNPIDLTDNIWIADNLLDVELLKELKQYLLSLHELRKEFIMQSIRDGNQTEGNLFHRNVSILNKVKKLLIEVLQDNCQKRNLPYSGIMNGAWSILMNENGHHVNHVHSEGTYSACFYISIPDVCKEDGNGWFKCGGANISQNFVDEDDYYIEPMENRLVIFPSHLSHGTNPLSGIEQRLTLAFDYKII